MRSLVQPLFDGPLDFVGDLHGELHALRQLLERLGYNAAGVHPAGRRLVFLGDLTDRGPDSPGVVERVADLVQAGRAQCVLGNHDLNLLLGHRKHDNAWFFGEKSSLDRTDRPTPAVLADEATRTRVLDFFRSLPLALEHDDLRVVHACWDERMIEICRPADDAMELHDQHAARIRDSYEHRLELDLIDRNLEDQNQNPVNLLTSGPEERAAQPFESSGKIRFEARVRWWEGYRDRAFCVFGHYSIPLERYQSPGRGGPNPPRGQTVCVDYGVGRRWHERKQPGYSGQHGMKLAALRYPELQLVFDDGTAPIDWVC